MSKFTDALDSVSEFTQDMVGSLNELEPIEIVETNRLNLNVRTNSNTNKTALIIGGALLLFILIKKIF